MRLAYGAGMEKTTLPASSPSQSSSRCSSQVNAWIRSTTTTITATAPTNQSRKPKASASERSGLGGCLTGGSRLGLTGAPYST